jgi:hypothetical protein
MSLCIDDRLVHRCTRIEIKHIYIYINIYKELRVKLVIYKDYTKIRGQQNIQII